MFISAAKNKNKHTSIAHFLSELLPVCFKLAWYSRVLLLLRWHGLLRGTGFGNLKRQVPVIRWLWRVDDGLLFDYANIGAREDTLLSSSLVPTTPP